MHASSSLAVRTRLFPRVAQSVVCYDRYITTDVLDITMTRQSAGLKSRGWWFESIPEGQIYGTRYGVINGWHAPVPSRMRNWSISWALAFQVRETSAILVFRSNLSCSIYGNLGE